jgi:2,3-bisphosphoglycerate-independent phosphoglycerate mutase
LLELILRRKFPPRRVFVHAFTDGRDTAPQSGAGFIERIESWCRDVGINRVASVIGRYYAMDRDDRWDRVERAYRMLVHGEGARFPSALEAVRRYYAHPTEPNRAGDEFIAPSVVVQDDGAVATIRSGDSVIFFNFRGDRPRELCRAFVADQFPYRGPSKAGEVTEMGFPRGQRLELFFATLTEYEEGLPVPVAFGKPEKLKDILGAYVSAQGLTQFRCAETEKYPHVTFFFNDYRDEPFPGELRQLIPSPRDVTTYDLKPEMSALAVTEAMLRRIETERDDLMVVNYANGDMVGHTGNLQAAIRAVETVDECVGRLVSAAQAKGGGLIITADHGNCEQMIDPATGGPHTAHTTYEVELILVDERYRNRTLRAGGRLADIAPTLLQMLQLPKPAAMSGRSLVEPP